MNAGGESAPSSPVKIALPTSVAADNRRQSVGVPGFRPPRPAGQPAPSPRQDTPSLSALVGAPRGPWVAPVGAPSSPSPTPKAPSPRATTAKRPIILTPATPGACPLAKAS
jgi:hypothetical protein